MYLPELKNKVSLNLKNGKTIEWGASSNFVLFAGPDIYEGDSLVREVASELKKITDELNIPWILKCSFDKANRTSGDKFRGQGVKKTLEALGKIKEDFNCALITDVHECEQVSLVSEFADVIQIPAFLCRQTDLLQAVAKTGKVMNIKKGQFLAPWDMKSVADKAVKAGNSKLLLCERGVSFGYNRLINDMTGLVEMRKLGFPVIMDATHSVQLPGGLGDASGGRREMIEVLARAAAAVGVDGFFMETHPDPDNALCDGPNSLHLKDMKRVLISLLKITSALKAPL